MDWNLTVGYMAEQINRGRLDAVAARGWQAEQAAAIRARSTKPDGWPAARGAAFVRFGAWISDMARPAANLIRRPHIRHDHGRKMTA